MNFADAIRQAAKTASEHAKAPAYEVPDFHAAVEAQPHAVAAEPTMPVETQPRTVAAEPTIAAETATEEPMAEIHDDLIFAVPENAPEDPAVAFDAVTSEPVPIPEAPGSSVRAGNVVRLELFLSPEQLSGLFRALIATQHGMMTLREAATYLRVNPQSVEQMATRGEIPALLIDGRWRFPKSSLDEWLSVQVFRNKGENDAA